MNSRRRQLIEEESSLHTQINLLKQVSLDIGVELTTQNRLLEDMHGDFGDLSSMLGRTAKGLRNLIGEQGVGVVWVLVVFGIGVLAYVYLRYSHRI